MSVFALADGKRVTLQFMAENRENVPPPAQPPTPAPACDGDNGSDGALAAFPAASASAEDVEELWSARKTKFFIAIYSEMKDLVGKTRALRYVILCTKWFQLVIIPTGTRTLQKPSTRNLLKQQTCICVVRSTSVQQPWADKDNFNDAISGSLTIQKPVIYTTLSLSNITLPARKTLAIITPYIYTYQVLKLRSCATANWPSYVASCFPSNCDLLFCLAQGSCCGRSWLSSSTQSFCATWLPHKWRTSGSHLTGRTKSKKKDNNSSGHHRVNCEYEE